MKIQSAWHSKLFAAVNRLFRVEQLLQISPLFFITLFSIVSISLCLLYSAGSGPSPWCVRQLIHFALGVVIMLITATTPIRLWYNLAYVMYAAALCALALTALLGTVGMGAQRWLKIASIQFQPSEIMRIALVVALARRFSDVPLALPHLAPPNNRTATSQARAMCVPLALIAIPVFITVKQPDLGTAMLLCASGGALFFFAGIRMRFILSVIGGAISGFPIFWHFLHDYQKNRILTFLNPERDPLGSGYHIIQSKIAIGSGGFWGKGFMRGTQGALDFLPEKHTDFIFTLLSEEFGFIGVALLVALYSALIFFNLLLSVSLKDEFARLVITGMTISFALYAIINIAMVAGLLPVVGIPLPLVSYGGTSMITLLISQGIILSAAFGRAKKRGA
ncbi:MAG: rod shape-determining protein RodA [Holosporales bacterium]|jgi:rod shape determining protein RodA|nr:rod shape-determining protein RodA [Holosporales bacterium]